MKHLKYRDAAVFVPSGGGVGLALGVALARVAGQSSTREPLVKATHRDPDKWLARAFGGMFIAGAGANVILLIAKPSTYDGFADKSSWPAITETWRSTLVPNKHFFIPLLVVFEGTVGVMILTRRYRRLGILSAMGFSLALLPFGLGYLGWSVPVIALLGWFLHRESHPTFRLPPVGRS